MLNILYMCHGVGKIIRIAMVMLGIPLFVNSMILYGSSFCTEEDPYHNNHLVVGTGVNALFMLIAAAVNVLTSTVVLGCGMLPARYRKWDKVIGNICCTLKEGFALSTTKAANALKFATLAVAMLACWGSTQQTSSWHDHEWCDEKGHATQLLWSIPSFIAAGFNLFALCFESCFFKGIYEGYLPLHKATPESPEWVGLKAATQASLDDAKALEIVRALDGEEALPETAGEWSGQREAMAASQVDSNIQAHPCEETVEDEVRPSTSQRSPALAKILDRQKAEEQELFGITVVKGKGKQRAEGIRSGAPQPSSTTEALGAAPSGSSRWYDLAFSITM